MGRKVSVRWRAQMKKINLKGEILRWGQNHTYFNNNRNAEPASIFPMIVPRDFQKPATIGLKMNRMGGKTPWKKVEHQPQMVNRSSSSEDKLAKSSKTRPKILKRRQNFKQMTMWKVLVNLEMPEKTLLNNWPKRRRLWNKLFSILRKFWGFLSWTTT